MGTSHEKWLDSVDVTERLEQLVGDDLSARGREFRVAMGYEKNAQ